MIHSSVFQAEGRWEGLLGAPLCGVGFLPGMLPSACARCSQSGEGWAAAGTVPTEPLHPTLCPAWHSTAPDPITVPSKCQPGLGILAKGSRVAVRSEMGEVGAAVPARSRHMEVGAGW